MMVGVDVREWHDERKTGIGRFLEAFLRVAHAARPRDRFLLVGNPDTRVRVHGDNVASACLPEPWTLVWDQVTLPRALRRGGDRPLRPSQVGADEGRAAEAEKRRGERAVVAA